MSASGSSFEETGIEVLEIEQRALLSEQGLRGEDVLKQMQGLQRIARAFVTSPETMLQVLVDSAIELCGADSAGISIEKDDRTDASFYHWIATAGAYSPFLNAVLPRYPSACGICLERGRPQNFRVGQRFFEIMGVDAPLVIDGLLFPWVVEETRGTIFVMSHSEAKIFNAGDYQLMHLLADFAAMAVRQQRQQAQLMEQAGARAAAAMANRLAHRINNPLQSLTNQMYMAAEGLSGEGAVSLGKSASVDLARLSATVSQLLALPYGAAE